MTVTFLWLPNVSQRLGIILVDLMSQDLFYFISNLAIVIIDILRITEGTVKSDSLYIVLCVSIYATKDFYFKLRIKYLRIV